MALLLALFGAFPCLARTWHVRPDGSGDAPTIQAAVDSSAPGDDVLLAPGTYTWTSQGASDPALVRLKAGITLHGESSPEAVVVDAEGQGSVVQCMAAGPVHIASLTITGGSAWAGGGIDAGSDARPVISRCIVRNNRAGVGGGIHCTGARIEDCQVLDNRSGTGPSADGGGIDCASSVIERCTFRGNVASSQHADGGGVTMSQSTVRGCWFESNRAAGTLSALGGGVAAYTAEDSVIACTFVANRAQDGSGVVLGYGGNVIDCVFVRNGSDAVFSYGGTIHGNRAQVSGCTLVGNTGTGYPAGVGGIYMRDGIVTSTIVAHNEGQACAGNATWTCCDVFGNTGGDALCGSDGGGNFSADPQFCAVDPVVSLYFGLQSDSPCAPGQHPIPCGLIGAVPVDCGTVSVQQRTWTELKNFYR